MPMSGVFRFYTYTGEEALSRNAYIFSIQTTTGGKGHAKLARTIHFFFLLTLPPKCILGLFASSQTAQSAQNTKSMKNESQNVIV